jgi:hypothetical protein
MEILNTQPEQGINHPFIQQEVVTQDSWSVSLDAAPHTRDLILIEAAYFADE